MTEAEFAHIALVNALRRGASRYLHSGAALGHTSLAEGLRRFGAERSDIAKALEAQGLPVPPDEAIARLDADDSRRRAQAGAQAVYSLIEEVEQTLGETLQDLLADSFAPDLLARIRASLAAMAEWLRTEILTLRAASEDDGTDLGFVIRRKAADPTGGAPRPARLCEVWFGTNRRPVALASGKVGFGQERDEKVYHGVCEVSIPAAHRVGSVGSSWWVRLARGDDRLRLAATALLDEEVWWEQIRTRIASDLRAHDAIVFLHGYRVRFDDAAIRAAQIGADLAIPGVMAFFSWPSRGRLLGYPADEATIEASEVQITRFLINFAERSGASRVHIIAHSMGNRALLRAVDRIAANASARTSKPFGQIILAAPDVDSQTFRQFADSYAAVAERTTLYVSSADLAVRGSRLLHEAPRIGFAPPLAIVPGLDTIDVSHIDLTLLGHGYVAESRPVLTDIHHLITRGDAPAARPMLRPLEHAKGVYWQFAA